MQILMVGKKLSGQCYSAWFYVARCVLGLVGVLSFEKSVSALGQALGTGRIFSMKKMQEVSEVASQAISVG